MKTASLTVFVPCHLHTENELLRMHPMARKRLFGELRSHGQGMGYGLGPAVPPVGIEVTPHVGRSRPGPLADAAGVSATLKPVLDGLVDVGVLPDDGPEFVHWVRFHVGHRTDREGLSIELESLTP